MGVLLKVLKVALITHKTVTAVGASIVITASVYNFLRGKK